MKKKTASKKTAEPKEFLHHNDLIDLLEKLDDLKDEFSNIKEEEPSQQSLMFTAGVTYVKLNEIYSKLSDVVDHYSDTDLFKWFDKD